MTLSSATDGPAGVGWTADEVAEVGECVQAVVDNVGRAVRGHAEAVHLAVLALVAGGHVLVEDVPGVGKTTLARALAASLDGRCRRVQAGPDLLPGDVTGVSVYDESARRFVFHEGPVFANVLLVDELNRAPSRAQAALLEVLAEGRVTVDGEARPVPRPFLVVATQNPPDHLGTHPLPAAQRDRFLVRVRLGYPEAATEADLVAHGGARSVEDLTPVVDGDTVARAGDLARRVHLSPVVADYVVRLVAATRTAPEVAIGASPRASLALGAVARVAAAVAGRHHVVPQDVKALAGPVLAHRLVLDLDAEADGRSGDEVLAAVLAGVEVPVAGPVPPDAGPVAAGSAAAPPLPAVDHRHRRRADAGSAKGGTR